MDERAIGLSPRALSEVFPFHFVLDGALRFTQLGPGLLRLEPQIAKGNRFDESFDLVRPEGLLSIDLLLHCMNQAVALSIRRTGIRFLGQFRECEGAMWMFVGSPWFDSAEALDASGLALFDFAPQDPAPLLLMKERARETARGSTRGAAH